MIFCASLALRFIILFFKKPINLYELVLAGIFHISTNLSLALADTSNAGWYGVTGVA